MRHAGMVLMKLIMMVVFDGIRKKVLDQFQYSPDYDDDMCCCSWCGMEFDDGDLPIRFWPDNFTWEIRLHQDCLQQLVYGVGAI